MLIYISNTNTLYDSENTDFSKQTELKTIELKPLHHVLLNRTVWSYLFIVFGKQHEIMHNLHHNHYYKVEECQL